MSKSVQLHPLEARRVLAYDLAVLDAFNIAPFARPGGAIHLEVAYDNIAEEHFEGTSQFYFTLTSDNFLGNADDIPAGSEGGPDVLYGYDDPDDDDFAPQIPSTVAPGNYHLAITIARLTGGPGKEAILANNTYRPRW